MKRILITSFICSLGLLFSCSHLEENHEERGEHEGIESHEEHGENEKEEKHETKEEEEHHGETTFLLNFEDVEPGKLPGAWYTAETNGRGTPGTWKVVAMKDAPPGKKVLSLSKTSNYGHTFNLFLSRKKFPPDLEISVKIKAHTGEEDQGGGIVWRAKDPANYYIARWNPLENNFRVYKVEKSRRRMFKSATIKADAGKWHEIKVVAKGKRMKIFFDGKLYLAFEDDTFTNGGSIGLWTKADAATYFDDLKVNVLE